MERSDHSDRIAIFRDICCSLLMLLLGLSFCFPLAMLIYYTYQSVVSSRQFCTLWIDVPGRIAIFLICYYISSMCGFLPLPQRYHLHSTVPFNAWRFQSWRRLFRNSFFRIPFRSLISKLRRNVTSVQEPLKTPLLQENNQERFYTSSPRRRRTIPISIPYPEKYSRAVYLSNPGTTPRNETQGITKSSNGSIASIDPSVGDIVLPIMPKKSSKRHYISQDTIKESESSDDRERITPKYRKSFTEIEWPGEASGNALAPRPDYQDTTRERPVLLTSDKRTRALTDDERLAISRRQERRGLEDEMPEVHIKNIEPVLDAKTFVKDSSVANEQPSHKYLELIDEERLVTRRQQGLQMSGNEKAKVDTTDDRLKVLTRNELVLEISDQSQMHNRNLHLGGASCINMRETSPEYCNTEAQMNFSETRNRNIQPQELATDPLVARERPLTDKYFEVTDDESFVTPSRLKELQISVDERPEIHVTDDRLKLLTRNQLLPETVQSVDHKRNLYPRGASCNNQAPSEYISSEAQLKFPRAHNRSQQSREATVSNEQEIKCKPESTEAQMNFPGTLVRNQQHDKETASSEQERVMRIRNYRTSLNSPLFPWIILRNSKRISPRVKEFRKNHVEFVKSEMRYPEKRNRRQVYLNRSLTRCPLHGFRSQSVIQTRLPQNRESVNVLTRNSFRTENTSSGSTASSDKRIEVQRNTSSAANEGNADLTTNLHESAQKERRVNMSLSHAMNLNRSLVDRATRRRRQLLSLRYQVYARTRSQIWNKTEMKTTVELEKFKTSDRKNSEHKMDEAGPSNLFTFEKNTKRTGMVTLEAANDSFNRLHLDDLRRKLTILKQNRKHLNGEASTAVGSKSSTSAKTTDKNNNDIIESNVSTKPSEADVAKKPHTKITIDSPLMTSESDSDSDTERSK